MRRAASLLPLFAVLLLLSGCGIKKERQEARENGLALMESGDYEGAIAVFDGLIEEARRVTAFELDVLRYRAEAEFAAGDYEAAAYSYGLLNETDKERAEYDYLAAASLAMAGDTDGARERLDAGRALDKECKEPGFDAAMAALAKTYEQDGNWEKAVYTYQECIDCGHDTAPVYNRMMLAAMEQGDYETALSCVGQGLLAADGETRRALLFNEAVCYEYLGDYEKALELFSAYVEEFGSDAQAEHEIAFLVTR
ncbi:MAG: tetratricopeptide repeat protein [Lachnospiraceae bacterium]|jgi:thioredoxin-like negative regulator of GroEL|nr:tetratricopeptide repeat protein [Lachnospiraceae bacterium]